MAMIYADTSQNSSGELTAKTPYYENLVSYFLVSTAALLIYDYCLTLDLEYKFVWSKPRSWSNGLYLIQRYLPLLDTMLLLTTTFVSGTSKKYCYNVLYATLWLHIGGVALSEVVLSMRVWAISRGRFRYLAYILFACFVTALVSISTVAVILYNREHYAPHPLPEPLRGCWHTDSPIGFALIFGILLLYECGCFALIIHPAIYQYKDRQLSNFYNPVYRDGIFQYILNIAMTVINIAMVCGISVDLAYVCMPLMRVFHSITTSRIVLHIREAINISVTYSVGGSPDFDTSSQSDTTRSIAFGAAHSTETEI
ncbi:hypothetical protein BT96DRAFT_166838 [Gymnopus androsaceus JB14]|uniref:DUF6533 domain-containing protein n=1 Tax=Gymnopus androsaceus JB14 TaxID=1447944 RepID=A0A6A4HAW0_9AGAR|nr:hypothetical protein BT96DRAFT_166838 [Gymnopus androsaceus JB14]